MRSLVHTSWASASLLLLATSLHAQSTHGCANWRDEPCQPTPVRVAGLPPLVPSRDTTGAGGREPRVRVSASRREVRVVFHTDTTRGWGWTGNRDTYYLPQYDWSLSIPSMDGPQTLTVFLGRGEPVAREFASLADVVRAASARQCSAGMWPVCKPDSVSAYVEGDALEIVLRDSARISRLFGMRPAFVRATEIRPERRERWSDSIRVAYVEPSIPEPDAATRADAARSRRRFEASITRINRFIDSPHGHAQALRVTLGDSIAVFVNESECTYDVCSSGALAPPTDSGWSVDDARIARLQLRKVPRNTEDVPFGAYAARYYLKALRTGRTTIRVHGVHGSSDTAASREPPAHELERAVVVTLPLVKLEITPRPPIAAMGRPLALSARVLDTAGNPVGDVPVLFNVERLGYQLGTVSMTPVSIDFRERGRTRIVAHAEALSDTLFVTVIDSASASPR